MNDTPQVQMYDVQSVDDTIKGSIERIPKSMRRVLNWIVGIYVGYTLVSSFTALPSIPQLAMEGTGGYRPVMWVIGLALGIGLTHVYDSYSKRSENLKARQKRFNDIQSGQLVNRIAKGFFFFAIALGVAEVVLMTSFDTTLSRMVFDWANTVEGSYHVVGMVTGLMVMVSLLGARLNAWYRLSMLIVSMVSAHIFWHLGSDAYWPYDVNHEPGHVEYMRDQDVLSPVTKQGLDEWEAPEWEKGIKLPGRPAKNPGRRL